MNTCKTCRNWKDIGDDDFYAYGIIDNKDPMTYKNIPSAFEVKLCKMPTQQFANRPSESNGFALVDGSQYYAVLATAENFGCVRYEGI